MLDQARRDHAQRVMNRNNLSLDTILPKCESYTDLHKWVEVIEAGEYADMAEMLNYTEERWDDECVQHMWDDWYNAIWPAIQYDSWICGASCGWCLQLLREQYLESEKWHIPMPELR